MTSVPASRIPDVFPDPFGERQALLVRDDVQVLGARFRFESNSQELLDLVDDAYAGLPSHRLTRSTPRIRVRLVLTSQRARLSSSQPLPLEMLSGAGFLGGATGTSAFVAMSVAERAALVCVPRRMLRFPYHVRYELIEFAVFTLAARVQGLAPLHAACVGHHGRGVLLMGASGAGKSTVALQCLLQGLDFVSEDSTFVAPGSMRATGVANFLHVRSESLRWVAQARRREAIRRSPVIRRRSGTRKFEVDLRHGAYSLARSPLALIGAVFLSPQRARGTQLLTRLGAPELLHRLAAAQPYAANQPSWSEFSRHLARLGGYELRRGRHPSDSVDALRALLDGRIDSSSNSSTASGRTRET